MKMRRVSAVLMVCCIFFPSAGWAQAQTQPSDSDIATARQLTVEGYAALKQKDFARAENRFTHADELFHAPTVSLGLARARLGLGKLVGAQEAYSRVVHTVVPADASPVFIKAIEDARKELQVLGPRVPSVVIDVKGSDTPSVTLDDVEVPNAALGVQRPVDPGKHMVRATAPGFATAEATVTLAEGGTQAVTLELKPIAVTEAPTAVPLGAPHAGEPPFAPNPGVGDDGAAHSSPLKPIGFAMLGLGAAGLIVGGVTGGIGLSKQSDLLTHCPQGACPRDTGPTYQSEIDTYQTMKTVSTISLIAGGALAVTGIILVVVAPKAKRSPTAIMPLVGPGFFGARGTF